MLSRLFGRPHLNALVTAVVTADGSKSSATLVDLKGRDIHGASLTAVCDAVTAYVASAYRGTPEEATATLQFAIYPKDGGGGDVIFTIERSMYGFSGRDIQGTQLAIIGANLEELMGTASGVAAGQQWMVLWPLQVSYLADTGSHAS